MFGATYALAQLWQERIDHGCAPRQPYDCPQCQYMVQREFKQWLLVAAIAADYNRRSEAEGRHDRYVVKRCILGDFRVHRLGENVPLFQCE